MVAQRSPSWEHTKCSSLLEMHCGQMWPKSNVLAMQIISVFGKCKANAHKEKLLSRWIINLAVEGNWGTQQTWGGYGENMQNTDNNPSSALNWGPWSYEAAMLLAALPCHLVDGLATLNCHQVYMCVSFNGLASYPTCISLPPAQWFQDRLWICHNLWACLKKMITEHQWMNEIL